MRDLTVLGSDAGLLRYAYVESSQGRLLVMMSSDGVVDVILGESEAQALWDAARRFPDIGFVPDCDVHVDWVTAVVNRVERPDDCTIIPSDLGFGLRQRAAG
jgi:hypothetical protein